MSSSFHSCSKAFSRFPALQTRISRSAFDKNLKRIQRLRKKLGENYAILGRDKRQSPLTERKSPSKLSQPPKPREIPIKIEPLLLKKEYEPFPIVPMNWKESVKSLPKLDSERVVERKVGLRQLIPESVAMVEESFTLELPQVVVPKVYNLLDLHHSRNAKGFVGVVPEGQNESLEKDHSTKESIIEGQTISGPFYNYGLLPSECESIFNPTSSDLFKEQGSIPQQELTRRILSVGNSSASQIRKFNTKRMVELFQRYPGDCGSSEVQGITNVDFSCSNDGQDSCH